MSDAGLVVRVTRGSDGPMELTPEERKRLDDVSLRPLPYPYWHQCNTAADRLGPADLALHAPHLANRKPRM